MTTGAWLASLSSAEEGSNMQTVIANIEGTYPVLTPMENFEVNITEDAFTADLDIISISADLIDKTLEADLTENIYSADLIMENYDVSN